ncbi:MAG: MFS transporter [Pseudomonadota bacterium]
MSQTSTPTAVRWRILALLVLASFISYVLRYNMSTAGPAIMAELALTELQFGWILAAFSIGYTLCQFPGGLLVDAGGARRTLTVLMALWAMLTVLTGLVPDGAGALIALIGVRFLVGVAHAPIYPATGGVVERWFPIGSWALPNGLSSAGLTLGTAATAPLLGVLLAAYGWRTAFMLLAPIGLLGAALWWWYLRDTPAQHPHSNAAEVALIGADRPQPAAAVGEAPAWRRVLGNRDVLLLSLSYFCMNYVFYQMFNWVYYYLATVRGFDPAQAGWATSLQWILAAVGATLGGFACDWLSRRRGLAWGCRVPAIAGLCASAVCLAVGAVADSAALAVTAIAASFFCNQLAESAYWAAAIGIGNRHAAAACGVLNTGGNAVGFVNALLVPVIASTLGWTAAVASGALFALVGALLWLFLRPERAMAA